MGRTYRKRTRGCRWGSDGSVVELLDMLEIRRNYRESLLLRISRQREGQELKERRHAQPGVSPIRCSNIWDLAWVAKTDAGFAGTSRLIRAVDPLKVSNPVHSLFGLPHPNCPSIVVAGQPVWPLFHS